MKKYYLEYENGVMTIKEIDQSKFEIKRVGNGNWFRISPSKLDLSNGEYFLIEDVFDTIEECVEWLGTYSKKVLFPNGELKYIN